MMDCRSIPGMPSVAPMRWVFAALLVAIASAAMAAQVRAPLNDSIGLNIGINCHWQQNCIRDQQRAMQRALVYVRKQPPPVRL